MKRVQTMLLSLITLTSKLTCAAALVLIVVPATAWASPIGFDGFYKLGGGPSLPSVSTSLSSWGDLGVSGLGGLGAIGGGPSGLSGPVGDLGIGACGECLPTNCCSCAGFPWLLLAPLALIPGLFFLFQDGGDDDGGWYTLRPGDNTFGDITPFADPPTPVPEPGSLVLLGAGALSAALWRRRRKLAA